MSQVTVIGNTIADLLFELPKHYLHRAIAGSAINLPFGSKLEASGYDLTVGGSGANVAVGLNRLGLSTELLTGLSEDTFGQWLKKSLEAEGLVLKAERFSDRSAISVVLRILGERTIITQHPQAYDYLKQPLPKTGWLHIGPLPATASQFFADLLTHIVNSAQPYSLNPSLDVLSDRDRHYLTLIRSCQILIINLEEAQLLTRLPQRSEPIVIVQALHRLGPKVVCLTCGEKGAYASDGQTCFWARAMSDAQTRIDATGAGDAFTSGFLTAFIESQDLDKDRLEEAIRYGMLNAASVVGTVGAQAGLLTRAELVRDLKAVTLKEV